MLATIQVSVDRSTAMEFICGLDRNLDQPEITRVLEWIRDAERNFRTRIHYGQAPVALSTRERDGKPIFHSLIIQAVTRPLDPDNADYLSAMISREELGDGAGQADRLVDRLEKLFLPGANNLSRILQKFIHDNR